MSILVKFSTITLLLLTACTHQAAMLAAPVISVASKPTQADYQKLREDLLTMMKIDQEVRSKQPIDFSEMERIDRKHTKRRKEIVKDYGWPTIDQVGRDGAHAAWILVQHADLDLSFQEHCLSLMGKLLPSSQVSPVDVAYMKDRILVALGKPQIYGTQYHKVNGEVKPFPIEDEEHVDERRKQLGLSTMAEQTTLMKRIWPK